MLVIIASIAGDITDTVTAFNSSKRQGGYEIKNVIQQELKRI